MSGESRIEYVDARRVLLDALGALRDHLDAVVLVGAQAVYMRTEDRLVGYQASPLASPLEVVTFPTMEPSKDKSRCLRTGSDQDFRWWRGRDMPVSGNARAGRLIEVGCTDGCRCTVRFPS